MQIATPVLGIIVAIGASTLLLAQSTPARTTSASPSTAQAAGITYKAWKCEELEVLGRYDKALNATSINNNALTD